MVSILSAKQTSYLETVGNEPAQAAAAGSSLVFTISLGLALINVVLSFFIKKPSQVGLKATAPVKATESLNRA